MNDWDCVAGKGNTGVLTWQSYVDIMHAQDRYLTQRL